MSLLSLQYVVMNLIIIMGYEFLISANALILLQYLILEPNQGTYQLTGSSLEELKTDDVNHRAV